METIDALIWFAFGIGLLIGGLVAYRFGKMKGHTEGFEEGRAFERHIDQYVEAIKTRNKPKG